METEREPPPRRAIHSPDAIEAIGAAIHLSLVPATFEEARAPQGDDDQPADLADAFVDDWPEDRPDDRPPAWDDPV